MFEKNTSTTVKRKSFMMPVNVSEGDDLIQRLDQLMLDNESSLVAARADREERSFNQSLRQQQDEAYMESLRADQEKVTNLRYS